MRAPDPNPEQPGISLPAVHLFSDANGESHLRTMSLELPALTAAWDLTDARAGLRVAGDDYQVGWHASPARRFGLTLLGEFDVEASDGTTLRITPGVLVFLEDTAGKGHRTIPRTPRLVHLFLDVPDEFDFAGWIASPTPLPRAASKTLGDGSEG